MAVKWPDHFPSRLMGRRLGSSGLSSFAIALEAWRRNLEVTFTSADLHLYQISDGTDTIHFNFSRPDSLTPRSDYLRLDRKGETNKILAANSIPSPRGQFFDASLMSEDELRSLAVGIGYPLVLKPNQGSMGRGVFSNIKDWLELHAALVEITKQGHNLLLLERHYKGDDFRILVVGDKVVSAVKRIPAHVRGDGKSTITKLIEEKNYLRLRNPFLGSGLIKVDYEVRKCLEEQNLSVDSIPKSRQYVQLRRVANASAGGDVKDVTDAIPRAIKEAAVEAVRVLPNIHIAGVDVLYDESAAEDYVIIEVNSRPQIGVNMYPSIGEGRDAPKAIIDTFFPTSSRSPIDAFKTIRFNPVAVRNVFSEGLASRLTLPQLPDHGFPIREKYVFSSDAKNPVCLRAYSDAIIKKIARKRGISGKITSNQDGHLELYVAASNANDVEVLVNKVSEFCGVSPDVDTWTGSVTVGFQIV